MIRQLAAISLMLFSAALFAEMPSRTAREDYLNGLAALERYDDYAAAEYFRYAIGKNPQYFEPHYGLARLLFFMERYEEALASVETAEKLNRESVDLMTLKGRIFVGLGRFDDARALFQSALQKESFNIEARLGLADLAVVAGTYDTALKTYESILKMVPEDKRALLSMIVIYDSIGDSDRAREYIEKCLSIFPNDLNVRLIAARHYRRNGDNQTAELHARIALDLKKDFEKAACFLATLYLDEGRTEEAENVLLPFLDYRCDLFRIYYLLGETNRKKNDYRKAADFYAQALELRYGDEVVRIARENLILSEDSLADLAPAEANRHFDDAETWFSRHYDRDARTEILRGLKLQPESIDGLKLLGRTYKLNRMYDHYTDLLQRLTEMYPEDSDLKDEWEIYDNRAQSRTAAEWKIDPLSVVRNRFPLALYIQRTPAAEQLFHYGLDEHLLRYYESFLTSDTDFFEIPDSAVVESFSQAFERAQKAGAASFLILTVRETDRSIQLDGELCFAATGLQADRFRITKTGNYRFVKSAEALSSYLTEIKPVSGSVIRYEFDKILINLGKADGLRPGDRLHIVRQGYLMFGKQRLDLLYRDSSVLGSAVVLRVEDLISECRVEKRFFYDFINEQDHVILTNKNTPPPQNDEQTVSEIYKEILKFD